MSTDFQDLLSLGETDRRHGSSFRVGVIEEADYPARRVRVRMAADALTGWLPFAAIRAGALRVWSPPSIGEQVMIVAPAGDLNRGVVMPAIYRDLFPAPSDDPNLDILIWDDGSQVSYHRGSKQMNLHSVGIIRATAPDGIFLN